MVRCDVEEGLTRRGGKRLYRLSIAAMVIRWVPASRRAGVDQMTAFLPFDGGRKAFVLFLGV